MTTRKTAYPDANTAIAIATEMALSVKSIIDALPHLGEKTKNRSIADEIKRVADTARFISLRVVTLVLNQAHDLVEQIESGKVTMEPSKGEAIHSCLNAVHRYVQGVAGGKIASGFSLHNGYMELVRLLPDATVSLRQEFFLPVSPVYGPNSPNYDEGRFIAEVARYNDEFRQSMRAYETQKDLETINAMRTTLVTMETKNPPSNFRMLLSLAISFMDVAMRNNGKIGKENEPLLIRLDRELSGVLKGELEVDEGTISWFMHVIGQANQFSARIRSFQESYELVRLIEEGQNTSINDQTISQMRNAMDNAQKTWESSIVTGGDLAAARNACFALVAVSNIMGDYVLKTMAMALGSLADGIVEKRVSADPEVAVFGASILVSMNERLERVSSDPKGGRAAADQHRDRVRAVLSGKRPSELNRESAGQGGHIQAILSELGNDIASAEQIIDQCLRDGAKDSKREEAAKLFNMITSALSFVNLADASAFASTVANHVDKVILGLISSEQPSDEDKQVLAESVMMLHRYISLINVDQTQAGQALQRGVSLFLVKEAPVQAEASEEQDALFDVCTDEDLGPIFFEEAKGVVADLILPGIAKLRSNINDENTMLDVRRGFHTLKGSARMVELNNLGMVGQHTEYALNIFRDNRNIKPNGQLLDWLEEAAHFFAKAVETLEQGQPARVHVAPYEAVYKHLSETNVFERVDLKKSSAPVALEVPLSKDVPSIAASLTPVEIEVHIPETGTVILPAPDLMAGGADVAQELAEEAPSIQNHAEHQEIALAEDLALVQDSDDSLEINLDEVKTEESVVQGEVPALPVLAIVDEELSVKVEEEAPAALPEISEALALVVESEHVAETVPPALPVLEIVTEEVVESAVVEPVAEVAVEAPVIAEEPVNEIVPVAEELPPALPVLEIVTEEVVAEPQEIALVVEETPPALPVLAIDEPVASTVEAVVATPESTEAVVEAEPVLELVEQPAESLGESATETQPLAIEEPAEPVLPLTEVDIEIPDLALVPESTALETLEADSPVQTPEVLEVSPPALPVLAVVEAVEELVAETEEPVVAQDNAFDLSFSDDVQVRVDVTPESNGAIAEVTERPDVPVLTEVVELAPVAEEVQEFAEVAESVSAPESVTETPPESSGEVEVGSVSLPTQIYNAFVNDGRSFQDSLQASIQDAITGKRKSVDFEVMRMAHSLAGMGRTTGLNAVTHLAERVEAWVSINQDRDLHLTDDAKAVLSDAMEALDAMIMGVTDKIEPEMELSIVARLQAIITADEHRIAMAVDTRPDVTDLVLEQLNDGDVMVTDEGVTPTSSSMLIQASLEQHAEAGAADMEVAKVPVPFRHSEESITDPIAAIVETGDTVDIVEESSAFQAPAQAAEEVSHGASEPVVQGFDGRVLTPEVAEVVIDFELPKDSIELVNASGQVSRASLVIDEPQQVVESQQVEFDLQAASEWTEDPTTASQQEYLSIDWLAVVDTRMDDVDPEMFDIFLEEADERFEEIDATLNALGTAISDKKLTNLLKRAVHTLKGSANTAGCRKLGAIFHHLEDMMEATPVLNFPMLTVLQSGVDAAFGAMTAMRKGKSVEDAIKKVIKSVKAAGQGGALDAAEIVESSQVHAAKEGAELDADGITESNASTVSIAPSTVQITAENTQTKTSAGDSSVPAAKDRAEKKFVKSNEEDDSNLRVSTRTLDKMVKSVGEINISRSRVSMNVDITKMSLTGLASSLELMYGYLRQVEMEAERQMSAGDLEKGRDTAFDALQMDRFTRLQELTRRVAEAQSDVMAQQGSAVGAVRDMEEALANQNVLVNEISSDLDQIRQVRVSSVVPVLKRVVRAACRDTEKMGEIFFDADVEIDRGILSKVMGSLEHILRNAVAHGLEKPEERLALGKEEAGTIEFRAYQDGGEVVIEVHDDGRGMDTQRIFDSAVKKGVIKAGAKLSESQIRELIFEPGFSTASEVTDIAGRGVGLDVVRSDISAMGGRVTVNSKLGAGSTFILRVPATLTVISGTAVLTNNHMYVIPVSFIDRLVRINGEELDKAYASQKLLVQDNAGNQVEYEFWGMWQIAGAKVWDNNKSWRNSVLLMSNDRVAVHIDEIRPATEFVFRPLGPQVANSNGLIGSTIASNGNASLVIDPSRVARTLRSISAGKITGIADQKKAPLILVVDDSTTVRKVTARMLKREGYRHLEAENGMKALEMLQGELPDVILMDIEMPVMNGYDASQAIRATPQTSSIPIIMITSRAGESHRRRAMEIGVNEYLGKPYNENDLIGLIRKFTGEDKRSRVVNG